MTKTIVYTCDVCNKQYSKPIPLHLTAMIGPTNVHADICCPDCAVAFAKTAAAKAFDQPVMDTSRSQ